jgi:hypothetical protein
VKLRNKSMHVQVARISVMDNPDAVMQRALVNYQLWSQEPLIGQNMIRRHELVKRTLFAEREKDITKLLPPIEQIMQEMQQQKAQAQPGTAHGDMHDALQNKTNKGASDDKSALGKRQGGSDLSPGSLGKKAPGNP